MHSYKMEDTWLSNTASEKDLRIVVDHKLNMSQQCDVAAKMVNFILGFININSLKILEVLVQHWLGLI